MIAVDTNVLLRLFVRDHAEQVGAAMRLLSETGPASIRISTLVLAELVWTLERRYRVGKSELIVAIQSLLSRSELQIEARGSVMTAMRWYKIGRAGFADYLIAALNVEAGASPIFTFDRIAAENPAFSLLS